jgi:hypothetical protein
MGERKTDLDLGTGVHPCISAIALARDMNHRAHYEIFAALLFALPSLINNHQARPLCAPTREEYEAREPRKNETSSGIERDVQWWKIGSTTAEGGVSVTSESTSKPNSRHASIGAQDTHIID